MKKITEDWHKKVPKTTINDDLKKYKNDPFFLKKLAEANEMIANGEMPSFIYEMQAARAATYADALSSADSLMVAHEPQPEYGKKKEIEE